MELQPALCIVLCALYVGWAQAVRRNKIFFVSYSFDSVSEAHESKEGYL